MSKPEFIKSIPSELQEKIGLKRFKISLIKCLNLKQVKVSKMLLEFKARDIFNTTELQTKAKATDYLKSSLQLFLLNENKVDMDYINYKQEQKINIITLQDVMKSAIKKQEDNFDEKMTILSKQGIDTKIKKNGVRNTYNAILKNLTAYFGEDYDIKNLDMEKIRAYASTFKNDTYIKNLKSIFKRASSDNDKIINWFGKLETSTFHKFSNINKDIEIFYNSDINRILSSITEEEQYYFKTLLFTGMRNDELSSIKKSSIRNGCFYFFDSKSYFSKVVPIHKNLLDYINEKMRTLEDDDYLFFENIVKKSRVFQIRDRFNFKKELKDIEKTLHKTRGTFITYLNFFKDNFSENDIKSLTHKLRGEDQESYNKTTNLNRLRKIINSIDLEKIKLIEEQI